MWKCIRIRTCTKKFFKYNLKLFESKKAFKFMSLVGILSMSSGLGTPAGMVDGRELKQQQALLWGSWVPPFSPWGAAIKIKDFRAAEAYLPI